MNTSVLPLEYGTPIPGSFILVNRGKRPSHAFELHATLSTLTVFATNASIHRNELYKEGFLIYRLYSELWKRDRYDEAICSTQLLRMFRALRYQGAGRR